MHEAKSVKLRGWVSAPDERGTIDIIWSCASTIIVCVWVMLHLNIPAKRDSECRIFLRKLKWFCLAMLAPELLMLFAGGQWAAAKRSNEAMKRAEVRGWTMVHAFYADSGGFVLQARDSTPFPVTADQVLYLIQKEHIQAPEITREEIWDRSKADVFARLVAALQSAWFFVQIIARGCQHLPITLLELSTIALMCCTAMTLFFWFRKPLNVETSTILCSEKSIAEILKEEGEAGEKPWRETPLDFAEPLGYTSTRMPFSHLWGVQERPLPRIPNDRDSLLHNWKVMLAISIPTAAFGTFQLIAWNFTFPTRTEQMLWRWTCISNGIVLGIGCALEAGAIAASGFETPGLRTFNDYKLVWPRNLMFLVPGAMYVAARLIVIVEVLISLRALEADCFLTVDWTAVLPHV